MSNPDTDCFYAKISTNFIDIFNDLKPMVVLLLAYSVLQYRTRSGEEKFSISET